jgi:hypothetical protein
MSETSDIDSVFWGSRFTYPIEIKEKSVARDTSMGEYFGLDIGPYVKLSFYSARRENFKSLFIVREVDESLDRREIAWWFAPFIEIAQYASWNSRAGGRSMSGGTSATVRIPKHIFKPLTREALASL